MTIPRLLIERAVLPADPTLSGTAELILVAALARFARQGFHDTSTRDLASDVGLQVGGLYVHFPSKAHILAELVRIGHDAHHAALQSALLCASSDPVDQVRALVGAHARFHCEHAMLAVVAHDEMHALPPTLAAPSLAVLELSTRLFEEVVRRGIELGRFHPPDRTVTTSAIGGMGMRIAHWVREDTEPGPERIAEIHAELALRMLGVTS